MFDDKDLAQMAAKGISADAAARQLEAFRKGFPWMEIVEPASPGNGINVLSEEQIEESLAAYDKAEIGGKCKFVPASGAASRMFKDLFAGMEKLRRGESLEEGSPACKFVERLNRFAFYDPELFVAKGEEESEQEYQLRVLEMTLTEYDGRGLDYGHKPKGVLKFHKYIDGARTPFEEHLVEAQDYMKNADGTAHMVVTVSPEHKSLFTDLLGKVRDKYEQGYGCRYNVDFTFQEGFTDTIAVGPDNEPFRTEDGSLLFRPGGHGALIYNLNDIKDEFVSIKNIDNVSIERFLPQTSFYKRVLLGQLVMLRDRIRSFLKELDGGNVTPEFLQTVCDFLRERLCIEIPQMPEDRLAGYVRAKLDRPIRVCGMVRNQGEPGGGPFIIREKDGSTSLQILESVQINHDDPEAMKKLAASTHFNPVDLACCLWNYKGEKFDLLRYVDADAGFISSKSYQGRELKALELPGLWNGSMSGWNTMFVEVPLITFNPVKVALDLLRLEHLG